ncbi:MAG: alpha/beta hydrolase [Betaproteobacteria bacterium]|nr:MAG: alpha/beta hydrolase [Betaproteobacteria bacterium]
MAFGQRFIDVDGCKLNLRRGGSGEPLLYLHEAGGAPAVLPFMEKLAERFDVLVPEHPGFGASDEPGWLENMHDLAYFYLDVLESLELRGVHLVGSSLGGWLALEMAVRDASRLKSLVLVGPAGISVPGVSPGDVFLWSPEELARNLFFDPALAEKMLAQPVTPELLDVSLKNRHTVARLGWEPRMHDPFLHKWLHRVNVPVKIIWGEADKILPVAYAREFKRLMPGAEIDIIPRCGHLPQAERPEEFCDIVMRFAGKG